MARAVWSGSLTFGLVSVPVQLATATSSHTVHFRQLERGTADRVRNRRVNERTGKEVPYDKIVKGYETDEGEYVIVEPEELDEITPGRSKTIEISGFVELDAIDPVFFDTTYFLQPRKEHAKTYGLLRDALAETNRAGVATMSMRQKDYLVAVHEQGGVLVMHTLHWADEVRDPHETLDNLPSGSPGTSKELKMATQLVETMAAEWNPEDFHDRTHERVRELIEAKRAGESVPKGSEPPESTNVVDLMSALEASVDKARSGRKQKKGSSTKTGGAKKTKAEGKEKGKQQRKAKSGGEDWAGLTKDELYQRASELNVTGRSRMNRDELQESVANAAQQAA
ncbi:Ku protein [Streptomyces sp. N2-109]|uniref:Non-homologous end joining protein Ku n=1 Tax=Streptomyces gossypii TaxID=2883101 RepID=A0ABT2JUN8_9ACTN|nr:Ku protein [Streptomyces gossypii]MCT2591593.1 Ku protein [Streptomyces gossypii]